MESLSKNEAGRFLNTLVRGLTALSLEFHKNQA
jgi:hypothetical protein